MASTRVACHCFVHLSGPSEPPPIGGRGRHSRTVTATVARTSPIMSPRVMPCKYRFPGTPLRIPKIKMTEPTVPAATTIAGQPQNEFARAPANNVIPCPAMIAQVRLKLRVRIDCTVGNKGETSLNASTVRIDRFRVLDMARPVAV